MEVLPRDAAQRRLTVLALQPRTAPISSRVRPSFLSRSASSIFSGVSAAA